MLVVSVPLANERPPLQGVSGMEDTTEDSVGGSAEGDREVEDAGPLCQRAVLNGAIRLPFSYECRMNGTD